MTTRDNGPYMTPAAYDCPNCPTTVLTERKHEEPPHCPMCRYGPMTVSRR